MDSVTVGYLISRKILKGIGYMWFLTNEGMDRYDGKEIRHYKLLDESKSLTSSIYLGWLYKGDEGRLWVISKKGGVFYYDELYDLQN